MTVTPPWDDGRVRLVMTVQRFHQLPDDVRADGVAWLDRVAPGRFAFEFEVCDEGRCRVVATLAGERTASFLTCVKAGHDLAVVGRALYTSDMPPLDVLQAMEVAA